MPEYQQYQLQLLDLSRRYATESGTPLAEAIAEAFLATPRHRFVTRYRQWGQHDWQMVTDATLADHLPTLYSNDALMLWNDDQANTLSSISQPSLVLVMIQMLTLEPGQHVFELGAGSGWNAALMGRLVAPAGQVYSLEIIPAMAEQAAAVVAGLGINNVHIIAGDGGEGYAPGAPYDRAIFTAGSYDLPRHFYTQLKEDALLLLVLKEEGGGDLLVLLQKKGDHFQSLESFPVGFVPMTGKYALGNLKPIPLATLPAWATLQQQEVGCTAYWWGGRDRAALWRTQSVRSFLTITEPGFRLFSAEPEVASDTEGEWASVPSTPEEFFGLWDEANQSLVLARNDQLIAYGNTKAQEQLLRALHRWVDLGMPSSASFSLHLYPSDHPLPAGANEWIIKRQESQLLWRLPQQQVGSSQSCISLFADASEKQ